MSTNQEIVKTYFDKGYHVVLWPATGAQKGPIEPGWPQKHYTLEEYNEKKRVGLVTGQEISPGRYLHDVDIDWAPGAPLALIFLPETPFVYGRLSKKVSHCFYTLPEALTSYKFIDPIDKTTLLEVRGTKEDGSLGFQSMVPPSIWASKEDPKHTEILEFRAFADPAHYEVIPVFQQRITYSAITMFFAKRFGMNGFGHEVRLAWAGFLLRAGLSVDELVVMGEAIGAFCNNREQSDVRRVIESTATALAHDAKKVKGGPALAKLLGSGIGFTIVKTVNQWLGREREFVRNADGDIIKDHQDNIKRAIQLFGIELSYQTFAEKMLIKEVDQPVQPLEDRQLNSIYLRIDREHRFRPTFAFYERVIKEATYEHAFHPVRDYLSTLTWDRQPRLDTWLTTYGGAEDPHDSSTEKTYLEAVSSIPLIAAVRRIKHPGCKYDEMLVLESDQGMNKSSALRALCPEEEWFSDDLPLNVDAKQIIERTLGKWIIEASDLVGGRKADRDHLKSMLSRQVDGPARLAYAHLPVERPRQFIIIGTTNSAEYLADMTGARRFWPVRVKRFDVAGIVRDRDQLWAEAVAREAANESIRLPERLYSDAGQQQEVRREIDAWEHTLEHYVDGVEIPPTGRVVVSTERLWTALGIVVERRDRLSAKRISEIMQRLGFTRSTVRDDGRVQTGYKKEMGVDAYRPAPTLVPPSTTPSDKTPF